MFLKKLCQLLALFVCLWAINTGYHQNGSAEKMTALLGEDVVLPCSFEFPESGPVPYIIQWHKQGIKIPIYIWYEGYPPHIGEGYDGRVSLTGQASLNLTNLQDHDQGIYTCIVNFFDRSPDPKRNGSFVHLYVHAPPHFRVKPLDVVYVKIGEKLSLQCAADGTPDPDIRWYKNNVPLYESPTVKISRGTLEITSVEQDQIGDYVCRARNSEGSVVAATKVIVAGPAVITVPPRNLTKLEGDKAEFICEAKGLPANLTHRWLLNGKEISKLNWLITRTVVRKDGTLFINPTSAEDSGLYTCEVFNGIGTPEKASSYLSVEYPARVTYSPTIQYLPLGLSGIIRCYVQSNPPFTHIKWNKDDRPFDPKAHYGVTNLNNGSLQIQRVTHEHQGWYVCTPYNVYGTAGHSNKMEVLVREPPVFTVKPENEYQRRVNSEVTMPCYGKGQPKPSIVWKRANSKKLSRDRSTQRNGNLTIRTLKKEDHGRYECVLQNDIATLVTSTLLTVQGTTPHSPTNVTVRTSAFSATLSWRPGYDGNYPQSYVIWYRLMEQVDSPWRSMRVDPDEATKFTIYNLQPSSDYEFRVLSRNTLGDGMFSPTVKARTTPWDYLGGVYPTDAYGATYIPTVQKPSGPKPFPPRNVTVQETDDGVLISWLSPLNQKVPVAFYYVEYRTQSKPWKRWGPIKHSTSYLAKDLPSGQYKFRVYAYSIMSVGQPSPDVSLTVAGESYETTKSRAVTAGVVGGILFFIAAIVLSICAVKICNKRKRRKAEKDSRNGGHAHAGSPSPIKNDGSLPFRTKSGISGLVSTLLCRLSTSVACLFGQYSNSNPVASSGPDCDSQEWPQMVDHVRRGRRIPKSVQYRVELEYSRPLGWISRTPEGKFVLHDNGSEERAPRDARLLSPSRSQVSLCSDASGRSSLFHHSVHPYIRVPSAGSRGFSPRSQVSFSLASQPIPTVYSPRDPRFRTSSPGLTAAGPFLIEDLSSVRHPSSAEKSFPSTVSSYFAGWSPNLTPSYELPSLRPLQKHVIRGPSAQFRPIQRPIQAQAKVHPLVRDTAPQTVKRPSGITLLMRPPLRQEPEYGTWKDGRHIHMIGPRPFAPPPTYHPRPIYWRAPHQGPRWYMEDSFSSAGMNMKTVGQSYLRDQSIPVPQRKTNRSESYYNRPMFNSCPPRSDRIIARVNPSPSKVKVKPFVQVRNSIPKQSDEQHDSSDTSSSDRPMTYTRERLLGAVERVRKGALHRGEPFQVGASEFYVGFQEPVTRSPPTTPSGEEDTQIAPFSLCYTEQMPLSFSQNEGRLPLLPEETVHPGPGLPHSRTSITSGSSGRGSKAASVSHSHGDSLQGELDLGVINRSSSSSGFASRNVSAVQSSTSPGHSSGSSGPPPGIIAAAPKGSSTLGDLRGPTISQPLDASVDENYEFDTVLPLESEVLSRIRTFSGSNHTYLPSMPDNSERGLSDSEIHHKSYLRPKKPNTYDNTEARCAALKKEFLRFRQKQKGRRTSDELESVC
ncbi:protein turtle homolog B-like isoform X2 [Tachypleus tridentatus]|uniref:protein turtle homolog B-like isoform X2 n=1 Tax=Tachypleus tridentatus TaxID=6853 RepID=UPI003FD26AFD